MPSLDYSHLFSKPFTPIQFEPKQENVVHMYFKKYRNAEKQSHQKQKRKNTKKKKKDPGRNKNIEHKNLPDKELENISNNIERGKSTLPTSASIGTEKEKQEMNILCATENVKPYKFLNKNKIDAASSHESSKQITPSFMDSSMKISPSSNKFSLEIEPSTSEFSSSTNKEISQMFDENFQENLQQQSNKHHSESFYVSAFSNVQSKQKKESGEEQVELILNMSNSDDSASDNDEIDNNSSRQDFDIDFGKAQNKTEHIKHISHANDNTSSVAFSTSEKSKIPLHSSMNNTHEISTSSSKADQLKLLDSFKDLDHLLVKMSTLKSKNKDNIDSQSGKKQRNLGGKNRENIHLCKTSNNSINIASQSNYKCNESENRETFDSNHTSEQNHDGKSNENISPLLNYQFRNDTANQLSTNYQFRNETANQLSTNYQLGNETGNTPWSSSIFPFQQANKIPNFQENMYLHNSAFTNNTDKQQKKDEILSHMTGKKRKKLESKFYYAQKRKLELERQNEKRAYEKTIPCEYFKRLGYCRNGDNCRFSHDIQPERRMQCCKYYLAEGKCVKQHCLFLHREWPCKFYYFGNNCRYGDNCKFSHETPEGEIKDAFLLSLQNSEEHTENTFENTENTSLSYSLDSHTEANDMKSRETQAGIAVHHDSCDTVETTSDKQDDSRTINKSPATTEYTFPSLFTDLS